MIWWVGIASLEFLLTPRLENLSETVATGLSTSRFCDTPNKRSLFVLFLAYFAGRILPLAHLNTILIC